MPFASIAEAQSNRSCYGKRGAGFYNRFLLFFCCRGQAEDIAQRLWAFCRRMQDEFSVPGFPNRVDEHEASRKALDVFPLAYTT